MGGIEQRSPSKQCLLRLLNDAYDGWGTDAYFDWRYNEYPEYDPKSHNFCKFNNGELVAFRRLYRRDLHIAKREEPVKVFMLGDTAVHKDHRGKGHYSDLHARTTEYCEERDVKLLLTYNNKDNITFAANRDRGWEYRNVPLYIHILSPGKVIKQYSDKILPASDSVETALGLVGDRIVLHTSGEPVRISELVEENHGSSKRWTVPVVLSDTAINDIVQSVNNRGKQEVVSTVFKLAISREIGLANVEKSATDGTGDPSPRSSTLETEYKTGLSTAEVEAVHSLYKQKQEELVAWFRREPRDIHHMTNYPNANVLLCRDGDEITGFAVIAPKRNENIVEARILDMVYRGAMDFEHLISEAVQKASNEGYDVLIAALEREPKNGWVHIDKQALMWQPLDSEMDFEVLHHDDVKVSLYDV